MDFKQLLVSTNLLYIIIHIPNELLFEVYKNDSLYYLFVL